jgi:hypothetical protein
MVDRGYNPCMITRPVAYLLIALFLFAAASRADVIPDAAIDAVQDASEDPGGGMDGGCGCEAVQ